MALTEYRRKRHFQKTPEPAGKIARKTGWSFVIQKHAASHLHYDFRLELDGVLKSWAVPKGPSLNPAVKRLAMQVEDHPVEYGSFEGTIPKGEYGGGTVLLWDQGEWEPITDPHTGLQQGQLKFRLQGGKLQGRWALIRTRPGSNGKATQWLLIKERDEYVSTTRDITQDAPFSVVSGRDLDEIASSNERVWTKSGEVKIRRAKKPAAVKSASRRTPAKPPETNLGQKDRLPKRIEVQLATLVDKAPAGDEWIHEIKFDGYRMVCRIDGKNVQFLSRNHLDWTRRMPDLVTAAKTLAVKQAVFDGEVVVVKADGTTDFQALQNAFQEGHSQELQYYVFDLLYLNGRSLVRLSLEERKQILEQVLAALPAKSPIHFSEHVTGIGEQFQQQACQLHLEGTIAKRRDQPYQPGRGSDWVKVKCVHKEEFVIGGYTDPSGSRQGIGALLMGFYDGEKKLHYAGKVGTGFDTKLLVLMQQRLAALEQPESPFADRTRKIGPTKTAHWVQPNLVAQITFGSRTRDGHLRHAVFAGLREDKAAKEVQLEQRMAVEKAIKPKSSSKRTIKRSAAPKSSGTAPNREYDSQNQQFHGQRLTNPDKLLYPDEGITKLDLATYYRDVAPWILPHIQHRPLVLVRCPEGRKKACFYQKHPGVGTPETLRQIPIQESNQTENYLVVDDVDGLIALAQIGSLEIHAWGAREDKLEQPDRLIFDLDPDPEVAWPRVVDSAKQIRDFLEALGLTSFVKTTGGKGLHLVVPIDRRHDWDEAKAFCKGVADTVVAAAPSQYTANMSKAKRTNKIFLDYLRNGRGATAIVPFSTRARPNATVSVPLTWKEVGPKLTSDFFTIRNLRKRLDALTSDPWKGIGFLRQSLTKPIKALHELSQS